MACQYEHELVTCPDLVRLMSNCAARWWGQVNHVRWGIDAIRTAKSVGVNAFWQTANGDDVKSMKARDDPGCVEEGSLWAALLLEAETADQDPMPEAIERLDCMRTPQRRLIGKQALLCGKLFVVII
jgi:hypothetical protein